MKMKALILIGLLALLSLTACVPDNREVIEIPYCYGENKSVTTYDLQEDYNWTCKQIKHYLSVSYVPEDTWRVITYEHMSGDCDYDSTLFEPYGLEDLQKYYALQCE